METNEVILGVNGAVELAEKLRKVKGLSVYDMQRVMQAYWQGMGFYGNR